MPVSRRALACASVGPFATHSDSHVWGSRSHDPSFPSDHASAAFGIAFAVLFFDRVAGSIFVAAAVFIAVGRVFIGAHYPADVAAGCLVGLASALIVVRLARPAIAWAVRLVERLTDPLLLRLWRRGSTGGTPKLVDHSDRLDRRP